MKIQKAALLWAIAPVAAWADHGYLSALNLPKAGSAEAVIVVVLLVALVAAAVLFELVKSRFDRFLDQTVSAARFLQNSTRFDLDSDERRLMRSLGKRCGPVDVNEIFYSLSLFEKSLHAEAADILRTSGEGEQETVEGLLGSIRKKLQYGAVEQGMPLTSTRNISTGQPVWILGPRKAVIAEGIVVRMRELSFSIKLTNGTSSRHSIPDSSIRLAFTRRADGIYGVDVSLVGFDRDDGTITCRHAIDLKRSQMRSDVRVDTDFSISIRRAVLDRESNTDWKPFVVRVVDISGGGLAFISERELPANEDIIVSASSPKLDLEGLRAKIVALSTHYYSSRTMYHCRFIDLDFPKKERIVKYVFEKLRELNQK